MNETLKSLVAKEGMAAVLATLRNLVSEEADELEELGEDAAGMEEVASLILTAARKYDELTVS